MNVLFGAVYFFSLVKVKKKLWKDFETVSQLKKTSINATLRPRAKYGFCIVRALVWGAGIPRGVSEPGWNLLYSDKGCRKFNGTVFYLILKLARGLDNNVCAFICFSFFVY